MRRTLVTFLAAVAAVVLIAAPASAKTFGSLYAEGDVYRTFGNPANVPDGTGTDPIFAFANSSNPDQLSVAQFAPGRGSHGGRWAVHVVTWTNGDPNTLVTSYEQLAMLEEMDKLTIVRDPAADFRCPILPNG